MSACEAPKDAQFGYLIGQTRNALFAALDKEMLPPELAASQFVVVIGAMRNRARTVNAFCQLAGIEPGPMRAFRLGWKPGVSSAKMRDPTDRRQVDVTLTGKGIVRSPGSTQGFARSTDTC